MEILSVNVLDALEDLGVEIRIQSLDNPGWTVSAKHSRIGAFPGRPYSFADGDTSEMPQWVDYSIDEYGLYVSCAPGGLLAAIRYVGDWCVSRGIIRLSTIKSMETASVEAPSDATFVKLDQWYARQCDGDWEHVFGVDLHHEMASGWRIEIDVVETDLEETNPSGLARIERHGERIFFVREASRKGLGELLFDVEKFLR